MTVLSTYLRKESELKRLQEELEVLKNNEGLKEEMAFKERIEALMSEYDKTKREVINLLDPEHFSTNTAGTEKADGRKKRKVKIYKNPHTGEVIETRGGNHKGIRTWKEQYGDDTVNSWVTDVVA